MNGSKQNWHVTTTLRWDAGLKMSGEYPKSSNVDFESMVAEVDMIYEYHCVKCGNSQDEECSVNIFKTYKPACQKCGGSCEYVFSPSRVQFILKDGPSGSWPSKGERIKKQRAKASEAAGKRQQERYKNPTLVPNFQGKETGTWRDAQAEALKEKGPATAATYVDKVKTESK